MKLRPLNLFLIISLVFVLVLAFLIRYDPNTRNVEFIPEMVTSIAYDTQSENPNFTDGKTQQAPVRGTIVRGRLPLHYVSTKEDAIRAGEELNNPYADSLQKNVERGAVMYTTFCLPCHGGTGLGDGLITKYGYPPPPSLLAGRATGMKEGQMFHVLTYGQGNMPSYATQISLEDRWNVILHVRVLQQKNKNTSIVGVQQ